MIKQPKINFDKLREKLDQLKNPGSRKNPHIWKPNKDGEESTVRLVQYPHGEDGDPFLTLSFHYGIGTGQNSTFLCLRENFGKQCPACEFAFDLYKKGKQREDEQDMAIAKKVFPTQRHFAVVLDRGDDNKTPKLWGFSNTVYQTLVGLLNNKDYGNYFDLYEGLDLAVSYKIAKGKKYPDTSLMFSRKESPLAGSDKEIQEILNKIPNHVDIYRPLTGSEIQKQLDSWVNFGESEAEGVSMETSRGGNSTATADEGEEESSTPVLDVEEMFKKALSGEQSDEDIPF